MTVSELLHKLSTVKLMFDPSIVDGCEGCPGPVFNGGIRDYYIANLLRKTALLINDNAISSRLTTLARTMVKQSAQSLINGWEEGDDICPPWRRGPGPQLKPQPVPWKLETSIAIFEAQPTFDGPLELAIFSPAMGKLMIAASLTHLAGLTEDANFNKEIFSIGQSIAKTASLSVFDEYCATKPRPKPRKLIGNFTKAFEEVK